MRFVGIPEFRLAQQPVFTGDKGRGRRRFRKRLNREGRDHGSQTHAVIRGTLRRMDQQRCNLVLRDPREAGIKQSAQLLNHHLIHGNRKMHQFGFHGVVGEHQHDDEGICIHIDEVKTLDRHGGSRRERQGRIIRDLRRETADAADGVVQFLELGVEAAVDLLRLFEGILLLLHQLVDIQAIAHRGRNPASGGMRLFQISQSNQLRQFVPDGGRGAAESGVLCQMLAAHRLGRADVFIHNRRQYSFFPFADAHLSTHLTGLLALSLFEC